MNTLLILKEINSLKDQIEKLQDKLAIIHLHPNCSYDKMAKLEQKLCQNGWLVIDKMVPYESYHGYGTDLIKAKEELTEWDKKFISQHEYGYVY